MARNGREKPRAVNGPPTLRSHADASREDADTLRAAVAAKEAELQAIADNTPLVLVRCGRDLRYKFINKAGAALFAKDPSEIVGKSIVEMMGEANFASIRPYVRRVLRGEKVDYEAKVDYPAAGPRIMRASYVPEYGDNGRVSGWLATLVDVTEHKRLEADQNFLFSMAEMIRTASNAEDLLGEIAEALGKYLGIHRCLFNEIDLVRDLEIVHRDYARDGEHVAGTHRISKYSMASSKAMAKGRTVVNTDSKTDRRTRDLYKKVYARSKERSYVTVPMLREDRWVASLWCSDDKPRNWSASEVALIESIAERAWVAVERVRNERQRTVLLEREAQARQEAETLNDISRTLSGELDLHKLVQFTTDAATRLVRAQFGAFFYNLIDEHGESYQLYTLSGAPRTAFEKFGMPRNTPIFDPTFRGDGVVRIDDVKKDPRYGTMSPHHGMPKGHLPVTSYLAAPVISRSGEVLGGLFFGHSEPGVFQAHDERMLIGIAAIAAVAMDNARLYGDAQREIKQRREVETQLRKSENQVRVVTDAMPALISYVDRDERYVFANHTYREWIGVDPDTIVGKKISSVFGPKAYRTIKPWVDKALAGENCRFEASVQYRIGPPRYVHAAYVPDITSDGEVRGYFGFTIDMTDLQRSQELLRVTEEKTTMMMDICRDYAIMSTDPQGVLDSWNTGAEQIFGYTEEEAIGMDSANLFVPEDRAARVHEKEMRTAKRVGRAVDERWHLRKDGTRFYASGVMMPLFIGKTLNGFAKIASDLTERQRHADELQKAHDELEVRVAERTKALAETNAALIHEAEARLAGEQQRIYLLRRLVTSQEFERRRIARDIHDQLGQRLTGLRLKLASLRSMVGENGAVADRVVRLQEISERLDSEVSFLAWELRPTALDDLGLVEALRTFVQEWSRHYEINADFQALRLSDIRHDPDVETHMYRITQEALNNTMKHARAQNITVMLERRDSELILIIEDDGVGFDPAGVSRPRKSGRGLGLMGMRERASLIGGELEIESGENGTTIFVRVPTNSAPNPL
jgi:PAS domain S-box-containing protein